MRVNRGREGLAGGTNNYEFAQPKLKNFSFEIESLPIGHSIAPGRAERRLRDAEARLRGAETRLRDAKIAFHVPQTGLRDAETRLRCAETALCAPETELRGVEARLRGTEIGLHGPEIRLRNTRDSIAGAESAEANNLFLNDLRRALASLGSGKKGRLSRSLWGQLERALGRVPPRYAVHKYTCGIHRPKLSDSKGSHLSS